MEAEWESSKSRVTTESSQFVVETSAEDALENPDVTLDMAELRSSGGQLYFLMYATVFKYQKLWSMNKLRWL